jgi:hypothetical protein
VDGFDEDDNDDGLDDDDEAAAPADDAPRTSAKMYGYNLQINFKC